MAATALALGLAVLWGGMTPALLLLFTFALGTGAALVAPAWQAVVPRAALTQAVAFNSLGVNLSRAIGPALGGAVLATLGAAWPFLLNAVSFAGVIAALLWWRPPPAPPAVCRPRGWPRRCLAACAMPRPARR
jgi:MFS family permease